MNTAGLSFDNIPPLRIPFGFFNTAPLFGILAGAVLLVEPAALESRWHPAMLAIVHLLTLGFAANIMLGALCQVMPVVGSKAIPINYRQALIVRIGVGAGALLLAGFFVFYLPLLAYGAVLMLTLGLGLFVSLLALALIKARPAGVTIVAIRFAALSVLITLIAGGLLLWWRVSPGSAPALLINTDQHAIWGTLGWGMLLVIGVSFQVIPMFHVAPDFPRWATRGLPILLFSLLLINNLTQGSIAAASAIGINIVIIIFCAIAALTLRRRKRKLVDYTVRFWQLGLGCIALTMLIAIISKVVPTLSAQLPLTRLLGVLFGMGGIISIILGMLQKIIPFLIYLHLQRACLTRPEMLLQLPNMKQLVPTVRSRKQWQLHLGCLTGLLAALWLPVLTPLAALLMLADFGWLWWTLRCAYQRYFSALPASTEPATPA
ncbi:MAG: hypothetical protein V7752_11080 [Halopseudomonas sp.]